MKRRVRKIANFFAFNLLFFALYLNFIHKDKTSFPVDQTKQAKTAAALSSTVILENAEEYLEKKGTNVGVAKNEETKKAPAPLNVSIN